MWKKTLALLLVLAMLVGFSGNFAFTASAADIDGVAAIGEVGYPTVAAAIEAAAEGDEIDLLTDVSGLIEVNKKGITLDLNGHTVTGQIKVCRPASGNHGDVVVKNGSVVATAENTVAVYVYNTNATLTDLNITSAYGHALNVSGPTIIEGKTTINSTAGNGIHAQHSFTITGDDVSVTGLNHAIYKNSCWTDTDYIVIEGGTFANTSTSANTSCVLYVDGGAKTLTVDIDGGTFTGAGSYTVRVRNGVVTVDDATFNKHFNISPNAAVVDVTINSGTFGALSCFTSADAVAGMETFSIVVNGGEINGQNLANLEGMEMPEGKTGLVINGGTFSFDVSKYGTVSEDAHKIQNEEGKYVIAAHTYDQEVATEDYFAVVENDEAKYYYSCVCGAKGTETFVYGANATATINGMPYDSVAAAIEAAVAGDVILVKKDTAEAIVLNKSDVTLNLNGKTVTGQIKVDKAVTGAVVCNGAVVATADTKTAVYVYAATATLRDLTITSAYGNAANSSGYTTIEGNTTITSTNGVGLYIQHSVTINGDGVSITGSGYAIQKNNAWTSADLIQINGGTFTSTSTSALYVDGGSSNPVTIDINGGNFVGTGSYAAKFRNGIVTVDDATFNAHFNLQPNAPVMDVTINSGTFGALSAFGGKAYDEMEKYAIVVNGGTFNGQNLSALNDIEATVLTVNGGTFTFNPASYGAVAEDKHCVTRTENDKTYYDVVAHTFDQEVATDEYFAVVENDEAKYYYSCACGAKGTETFVYGANATATINGKPYNTVAEAIEAANEGDEIILKKDVAEMIEINKDGIILNLNGKTVTGGIKVNKKNNAVICNGSVVATAETVTAAVYVYAGTATLRDLTVTSEYGSAVNVSGATVIEGKTTITSTAGSGIYAQHGFTINGNDVSVTGLKNAIYKYGNWSGADTIVINGGTFTNTNSDGNTSCTLYIDSNSTNPVTVDINGGNFVAAGSYTVRIRDGILTIDDASFNTHVNANPNGSIIDVTINSGNIGALSVFSAAKAETMEKFSVVVNGGNINGKNLDALKDTEETILTINGGTFAFDPTAYNVAIAEGKHCAAVTVEDKTTYVIAEHAFDQEVVAIDYLATSATAEAPATYYYSCVCGAKGTETFVYGPVAIATINGAAYGSLTDAIANAVDGDTIVLQADIAEGQVKIDKSITVDLNGKTVTGGLYATRNGLNGTDPITGEKLTGRNNETNATICNGTVVATEATKTAPVYNYNTRLTIRDVAVTSAYGTAVSAAGYTTIEGNTTITSTVGVGIYAQHTFVINGENVSVSGATYGIQKPATWTSLDDCVINGGTFYGATNAVRWDGSKNTTNVSSLTINGGTFNADGSYAIFVNNGKLVINAGTINKRVCANRASGTDNIDFDINGGNLVGGLNIHADSAEGCAALTAFTIDIGGDVSITGPMNIQTNGLASVPEGMGWLKVTNGTFSKTMAKYCVTGHTVPVTTVEGEGEEAVETTVYVFVDEEHIFDQEVASYDLAATEPACAATEFYVSCVCGIGCEETFTAEALGHNFKASDFVDCLTPIECTVCKEIVAPGHELEIIEAVLPTCTTTGMSEGARCVVCDTVVVEPEEVGVVDHDYSYTNITDKTHDKVCSVGGETATEEHAYTDGFCVCGAEEPKAGCEAGVHTYTNAADAICNLCGERREDITPLSNANIKYTGNYLSFQEYIGMQPLVKTSLVSSYAKAYVKAVQTTAAGVLVKEENLALQYYSGTYSMVDMQVMAWDMTDNIKLTIVVEDADGVVTYGQTYSTSVEQLALEKLPGIKAQNNAKSEQQCRILVDMLNYGAAVQVAYSHNANSLPNTNLGEYAAYATTTTPEIAGAVTSTGSAASTIQDLGIYTTMQAQVELTMYIGLKTGAGDISDYELHITPEGGQTQILGSETFRVNGKYYVPVFALKAKDFRTNHTMQLVNKTTGQVVTKTYVASIEAKASAALSDATLGPVVVAMMKYGDAVAAYLAM